MTAGANHEVAIVYLAEARRHYRDCAAKINHCVEQLSDEQVWRRAGDDFNSIGNLLLHLSGNISQRVLSLVGGEADQRDRQAEFDHRDPIPKAALLATFNDTLRRTDALLAALPPERLLETRRYRMLAGEVDGTVLRLILQTLVHLGGHTQEIVAMTRLELRERYRFQQPQA